MGRPGQTIGTPIGLAPVPSMPPYCTTSTKLGFKNPKRITSSEVTKTYQPGYWKKQGFNWFSGI